MTGDYWQIAVNAPLPKLLTYTAPDHLNIEIGMSVVVPLGRRKVDGVVTGKGEAGEFTAKDILQTHPEHPVLETCHLKWMSWLSQYYQYPPGQVAQLFFPPLKKHSKRKSRKAPLFQDVAPSPPLTLNREQSEVFESIRRHKDFSVHLLHGITGSGKTEVYLHLLSEVLERGQQGLVLVPEIALTPQLTSRFTARFGPKIAAIHSHLTEREKTDQWWSMVDGTKKILIGARSALFCPLKNIGLIVIDEEHEASFKQEEKLKYHARDSAIVLARNLNCPVVLGSATPSLESWHNVKCGKYHLHKINSQAQSHTLPEIQIVDLKKDLSQEASFSAPEATPDLPFWMSPQLYKALADNYANGQQAALFLNRRGIAQAVTCTACGETRECPNCAVSLTLHGSSHLVCHYCNYHENKPESCPSCHEGEPTALGLGTELVEKDLSELFPKGRMMRADRDEITNREQLETLIQKMENHEIDFLIGTQMIAKGLDFPHLKVVGLVLADIGFNIPDFRASERIYQLITQMSGRAGRHTKPGESPGQVIVQTFNPDHPSLKMALAQNYEGFADYELHFRQELNYPPIGRLASIRIQGSDKKKTENTASTLVLAAEKLKSQFATYSELSILGPAEAPLSKLRGQFRYHCMIKTRDVKTITQFCHHLTSHLDWVPRGIKVQVDIDPFQLL